MEQQRSAYRSFLLWVVSLLAALVYMSALSVPAVAENEKYLKVNIHYQQHSHDAKGSFANWTDPGKGHAILPVNTPVEFRDRLIRSGFTIIAKQTGQEIIFEYDEASMKMTEEQYMALITSPHLVPIEGFSDIDRKGISEGRVYQGMSKKGVMTALGYPAAHRTPSLDDNKWVYWKNRIRHFTVEFDDNGLAKNIQR